MVEVRWSQLRLFYIMGLQTWQLEGSQNFEEVENVALEGGRDLDEDCSGGNQGNEGIYDGERQYKYEMPPHCDRNMGQPPHRRSATWHIYVA